MKFGYQKRAKVVHLVEEFDEEWTALCGKHPEYGFDRVKDEKPPQVKKTCPHCLKKAGGK